MFASYCCNNMENCLKNIAVYVQEDNRRVRAVFLLKRKKKIKTKVIQFRNLRARQNKIHLKIEFLRFFSFYYFVANFIFF